MADAATRRRALGIRDNFVILQTEASRRQTALMFIFDALKARAPLHIEGVRARMSPLWPSGVFRPLLVLFPFV